MIVTVRIPAAEPAAPAHATAMHVAPAKLHTSRRVMSSSVVSGTGNGGWYLARAIGVHHEIVKSPSSGALAPASPPPAVVSIVGPRVAFIPLFRDLKHQLQPAALLGENQCPSQPAPAPVARFSLPLAPGQIFTNPGRQMTAISPDGRQIVYVANQQLYLRELASTEAQPIAGTTGG